MNYYNEHDPKAAAWLRELIAQGHLPPGFVDSRDIQLVQPADLVGYTQCHFFAGIGGWSLALHLAGIPTTTRLWTGSCPCQPFSVAGKGLGKTDPRHLWPQFRRLIRLCRPPVVFGEQVASAAGRIWLSGVCADLEALAYRTAAADLCAAGGTEDCEIGILRGDTALTWERATLSAPHLRQRLWWCAGRLALTGSQSARRQLRGSRESPGASEQRSPDQSGGSGGLGGVGVSDGPRWQPGQSATTPPGHGDSSESEGGLSQPGPASGRMAHAEHPERGPQHGPGENECHRHDTGRQETHRQSGACRPLCDSSESAAGGLANTPSLGSGSGQSGGDCSSGQFVAGTEPGSNSFYDCPACGMGYPHRTGLCEQCQPLTIQAEQSPPELRGDSRSGGDCSAWAAFDLIPCRDGKARRIESVAFWMADGLSEGMAHVWRTCLEELEEKITAYAQTTQTSTSKTLSELRKHYGAQALQWTLGRSDSFHGEKLLFTALCELQGQLGRIVNSPPSGGVKISSTVLRTMREDEDAETSASRPPQGWGYAQQLDRELADIVRQLPQEISSHIRHNGPLVDGLPGRVGLLRGYGNAIVSQRAADFIQAALEALSETLEVNPQS